MKHFLLIGCLNVCLWFSCLAVLQLFCSSPKAALRYAAVRTLNKVGASLLGAVIVSHVQGGAGFGRDRGADYVMTLCE